jgi:hypothetical protein
MRIDGSPQVDYTDNWNGVRVENCVSCEVRNNDIRNFQNATLGTNGTAVTLYGSPNAIVEYNFATNMATGLMFKDTGSTLPQSNIRVRYNKFDGVGSCIRFTVTAENRNYVHNNLCLNSGTGLNVTGGGLSNDWIFNNTYYNLSSTGLMPSANGAGGRFWNNIIYRSDRIVYVDGTMPADSVIDLEHNVYFQYRQFYYGYDSSRSFELFKSTFPSHDSAAPASFDGDPQFMNVAGGDFRLSAGSPAMNRGIDLLDLDADGSSGDLINAGAYVTGNEVIGICGQ